jgi:hypothetical protein
MTLGLLTIRLSAASLAVSLLAENPVRADTASALLTLDTTELELVERNPANTTVQFKIPARLGAPDVKIISVGLIRAGATLDPDSAKLSLEGVAQGRGVLSASFDLAKLSAPGSYVLTIVLSGTPQPAAAAITQPRDASGASASTSASSPTLILSRTAANRAVPPTRIQSGPAGEPNYSPPSSVAGTTSGGKAPQLGSGPVTLLPSAAREPIEQTVQLKLSKPAAELRMPQSLQLDHLIYFPWVYSTLSPTRIALTETQGKSWVKIEPNIWRVGLRKGEQGVEQGRLDVTLPSLIEGWGQADATVRLDGPLSLGTLAGTVTIRAPQLAAQTADFPIQVLSRVSPLWLLPPIWLGIWLGTLVRDKLEKRRTRIENSIAAESERGRLDDEIAKAVDRGLRDNLNRVRADLGTVIDAENSTPEQITTAATKAAGETERLLKEANAHRNELRRTLDKWRLVPTAGSALPKNVERAVDALAGELAKLSRDLEEGQITSVGEALERRVPSLVREIAAAIEHWLEAVDELKLLKAWPEIQLAEARQGIETETVAIRQSIRAAITPELLSKLLLDTDGLLRRIQGTVCDRTVRQVGALAQHVRDDLRWLGTAARTLDAIKSALDQLLAEQLEADEKDLPNLVISLNAVWAAIHDALAAAWQDPEHPLPGLREGRFADALEEVRKTSRPAETLLGDEPAPAEPSDTQQLRARLAAMEVVDGRASAPPWILTLEADPALIDRPVEVRAHVINPSGFAAPDLTLSWYVDGRRVAEGTPEQLTQRFTFDRAGRAEVRLVASDSTGTQSVARLILVVDPLRGAAAVGGLRKTLAQIERILWLVSAGIITVAGWIIFAPTFVGTLAEFFAAFLWGFTVDIGAAKVRELSGSVQALKPTVPVPKPAA